MFFVTKTEFNKIVKKIRCLFCDVQEIKDILEQNNLTTSTTTTTTVATTTTTTTTTSTTTTTTL